MSCLILGKERAKEPRPLLQKGKGRKNFIYVYFYHERSEVFSSPGERNDRPTPNFEANVNYQYKDLKQRFKYVFRRFAKKMVVRFEFGPGLGPGIGPPLRL